MLITNEEVFERAKAARLPATAFAVSGRAKDIALVLSEEDQRGVGKSVEFHTIDVENDSTEWAEKALTLFNSTLHEGEPARSLVKVVELGPTMAHVYVRLPAGGNEGELFKCSKCGLVVHGSPTFNTYGAPYRLVPPPEKDQVARRRFYDQCGNAA